MPSEPHPTQLKCEVCGARVPVLRRNRCWGCYSRWVDSRPVGLGAACAVCSDQRREHLKLVELLRTWVPLCHNCAARATQLSPMPRTMYEIRKELSRDRREDERRRAPAEVRADGAERRGLERRDVGAPANGDLMILGDDEMEYLFDDGVIGTGVDSGDHTARAEDTAGEDTRIQAGPLGALLPLARASTADGG